MGGVVAHLKKGQPACINARRRIAPRCCQLATDRRRGKLLEKRDVAAGQSSLTEAEQQRARLLVERTVRQLRIMLAFAGKKTADIAAILAKQRHRIVFGVALKEHK